MMTYSERHTVRSTGVLAAVGVHAVGLAAGSPGRALAGPAPAASQTAGFQSLGQMPGSAMGTDVSGISGDASTIADYGWICTTFSANGSCQSADQVQAFRWTPADGYRTLGSPGSSDFFGSGAVSFDGSVIVGEHPQPNQYAAFRWTAPTGMVGLPINIATAVTPDGGLVAGGDSWWTTTGQTGTFGPFPGFQDQTEAYGLAGTARAPVAVGGAIKGSNAFGPVDHAFLLTPGTGLQDLGVLSGGESIATAISADEKVVVGEARLGGGLWHAFRWTATTGMIDLGTFGGAESAAFAVNGDGSVIVGSSLTSQSSGSDLAFRWTAKTGMQDLTKLVNAPQRLIAQSAIGVSQDGTVITGNGRNTRLGIDEPWRAALPLPQ
jgi:probable HAF family extracellular repeat protein